MTYRRFACVVLGLTLVLFVTRASALPSVGARAPEGRIVDADGHAFVLRVPPHRPVLILYEDKGSAEQNATFKAELAKLAAGDKYKAAVGLVAVADVSGYDYWPVRGFVASAIRSQSKKFGTTIYCDWSGDFRAAFGFQRHVSNVVLMGRDGSIVFSHEGALDADERARLIALLRAEVDAR